MRRWHLALGLSLAHAALIAFSDQLANQVAPALAATVYLPLWPLGSMGLPVWMTAESGGWSAPSLLGWLIVAFVWFTIWWLVSALLVRRRK